ncbi:MAG TPA: FeoB small GTPase domain-containing protein, partial [Thermodesulfobacteriota bacterium]|nr:FeoB small GTPase domain-containing protein [Thermodesulfobacteriota bacterium]
MAGKNLKVGNWAGVTVEKSEVYLTLEGQNLHIIDLPGIYDLKGATDAEKVAVNFLLNGEIDIIVDVIDLSNFKRNLLLTFELMHLGKPVILALNMVDESRKSGVRVDVPELQSMLDVRACFTVGKTGEGVNTLMKQVLDACGGIGAGANGSGKGSRLRLPEGETEESEEERWRL